MSAVILVFLALLGGCALFVAATGLLGTALALRAADLGFSDGLTGGVMAAYYLGFVSGTRFCPRIIGAVGHIRAFSVFAAVAAASVLFHALLFDAVSWALLRFVTGVSVVGLYMVIESWLNEKATNQSRGRVLAAYQVVALSSLAIGQWLLLLQPGAYATPLLLGGALFALGLVPVALTRVPEPPPIPAAALDIRHLWKVSPLGVTGTFTTALANGALFSLGPLFAEDVGLDLQGVVIFMSLTILGGVTLQWPIGHLSDTRDRRTVILLTGTGAALLAGLAGLVVGRSESLFFLITFLYGGFTFSLYPLCVSHSNDHVAAQDVVRTAGGLLLVYGIGAAMGPAIMGQVMGRMGETAFFLSLCSFHAALSVAAVYRMIARAAPGIEAQEPFVIMTRTSQSALNLRPDAPAEGADSPPGLEPKDHPE